MLPRYRETGGMDHVSLDATRLKPARQPEAVAAGFESQRNPRDGEAGPDRLIPPVMQQCKQPFWARLQLFARLTFNTRNYAANQPARVAQLDDGNDRAILVQGDEGSAQVIRLGHRGTPSVTCSDEVAISRRPPHSIYWSRHGETPFGRAMWAPHGSTSSERHWSWEGRKVSNPVSSVGESVLTSAQTFSEPICRPASQTSAVAECDRRPDHARSKLLAGLAHTLTDLTDFPAGELGETACLGLKGARQVVTVARGGVAGRRPGIGMPQNIATLEILPVGGFLQQKILGEMVAIVTHMQPRHEDWKAAARARTAFHALRVGGAAKPGDAEAL